MPIPLPRLPRGHADPCAERRRPPRAGRGASRAFVCVLVLGSSVVAAQAQTLTVAARAAAEKAAADQATPSAAAGASGTATPIANQAPDLQTRTKNYQPTRFNLAATGSTGLIQAVSPYTLRQWELATGG